MGFKLTQKSRLSVTIAISFAFFVAEISIAFKTRSLALIADAFHYMNDLVGFIVALVALIISERSNSPPDLSFGWQRARLLGAFFNGVFLLALGISIFLQAIERFVALQPVENPKLVLIVGCVGLGLNIVSALFLHEHNHDHGHGHGDQEENSHGAEVGDETNELTPLHPHAEHRHLQPKSAEHRSGRDLNMLGALVHVAGDALNNIGVILSALVIWKAHYYGRYYADPGVSLGIAVMILLSALPLVKNSGTILLESAPQGVELDDVRHDLEKIPGIESVHELHIWRLDQKKAIASAHVVVSDHDLLGFMDKARTVSECLHAYGIHSATLQPELSGPAVAAAAAATAATRQAATGPALLLPLPPASAVTTGTTMAGASSMQQGPGSSFMLRKRINTGGGCQIPCGSLCENLMCCTSLA